MTHFDASVLATYNALSDPHLENYFNNQRIRSHLKNAGLINNRGEIVADGEYRSRLAQREHRKHVRNMLAENIVCRAIDMERERQAKIKREQEVLTKAAMVNNIKESRRRSAAFSGFVSQSGDISSFAVDRSYPQSRPRSANLQLSAEMFDELTRHSRNGSAHQHDELDLQQSSKTLDRRQRRRSPMKRAKSSNQRIRSPTKNSNSKLASPDCRITMVYYGPHTKVDYDHLVFDEVDEILVMQQHCGGENRLVFKDMLKVGDEFTFSSRRHSDYPFGLSLYVKGLIDSRISTCCEYKHRRGVRLGGDRGHFAIKSVQGSKPCIKCRYEKEARLKKLAQSPKDKSNEVPLSIQFPMPMIDQSQGKRTPVQIPVHDTSNAKENYSEDFDGSDRESFTPKKNKSMDQRSLRSSTRSEKRKSTERKRSSHVSPLVAKKPQISSDDERKEIVAKKTWQIIFHPSNILSGNFQSRNVRLAKKIFLKFSLINRNNEETENYQIDMRPFIENSRSPRQQAFSVKFKSIGKPEEIRVKIEPTDDDDEDEDDATVKWHLDRIELIDPEDQSHLIFPCRQWIEASKHKILRLSQDSDRSEARPSSRPSSASSSSKRPSIVQPIEKRSTSIPLKESDSSHQLPAQTRLPPLPPLPPPPPTTTTTIKEKYSDTEDDTDDDVKSQDDHFVSYRLIIFPSKDEHGEFSPAKKSRIYVRLNNQKKETKIKSNNNNNQCPNFRPGENQRFIVNLPQSINEQPKTLTIGYINSDITASQWKLEKIVLVNTETGEETTFKCKKIFIRDEITNRAEQRFEAESKLTDDETTPRNAIPSKPKEDERHQSNVSDRKDSSDRKSPSVKSFSTMNDDEANYKTIFKQLDPDGELNLGSTPSTPSSKGNGRRKFSSERTISNDKPHKRPSIDPLEGLEDLNEPTARSIDPSAQPVTTDAKNFKKWYSEHEEEDD